MMRFACAAAIAATLASHTAEAATTRPQEVEFFHPSVTDSGVGTIGTPWVRTYDRTVFAFDTNCGTLDSVTVSWDIRILVDVFMPFRSNSPSNAGLLDFRWDARLQTSNSAQTPPKTFIESRGSEQYSCNSPLNPVSCGDDYRVSDQFDVIGSRTMDASDWISLTSGLDSTWIIDFRGKGTTGTTFAGFKMNLSGSRMDVVYNFTPPPPPPPPPPPAPPPPAAPVPLPAGAWLLLTGVGGLLVLRRRGA